MIFKQVYRMLNMMQANTSYGNKLKYLRKAGARIGDRTKLNCSVAAFGVEPYLVSLGENCLISSGVRFITHDGGVKVLSDLGYFGDERMDLIAPVKVGNNVYIGVDAFIMPGVTIGDNCVIGAKAIVTKDIPDNSVAVGIPARVIRTIDEYYRNAVDKGYLYPTAKMSVKEKKTYFMEKFK